MKVSGAVQLGADGPPPPPTTPLHPPPPPTTPSAPWVYQQEDGRGGGGGRGGPRGSNAPSGKKAFSKKKMRVLRVDLHGDPQLEQSKSEVQTRSRSQTPTSRPASHSRHARLAAVTHKNSTPVRGGAPELLDTSKHSSEGQTTEEGAEAMQEQLAFRDVRADCHGVLIQPMNLTTEVTRARQQSGQMTRDSEREIAALMSERRAHRPHHMHPALTKDQLLFASAYVSVATSAIKTLENLDHLKRKDEVLSRKAAQVARLKEDRVTRAGHVEAFRQSQKDGIHAWKDSHVEALLKRKRLVAMEKGSLACCHVTMRERKASRARTLKEDREFEIEFNMQNVAIGDALADEDKRTRNNARQRDVRVVVEERREELERGVTLVKGYLRRREADHVRKGVTFKKDLEAKMCEVSDGVESPYLL